jgi:tripartite-type tricarboxylate transporter receptor subunit TctC
MELLKTKAGIAPVHVPYPGNPQIITAMIGGQVQLTLLPPAMAAPQVRGANCALSAPPAMVAAQSRPKVCATGSMPTQRLWVPSF